jgi:PleD family two-component response regulator
VRVAFQAVGIEISGQQVGATVSVGVASALAPVELDDMLARADAALYRAKNNGRNRVESAGESPSAMPAGADSDVPVLGNPAVAMR